MTKKPAAKIDRRRNGAKPSLGWKAAYDAGFAARFGALSIDCLPRNPHERGSHLWMAWEDGAAEGIRADRMAAVAGSAYDELAEC